MEHLIQKMNSLLKTCNIFHPKNSCFIFKKRPKVRLGRKFVLLCTKYACKILAKCMHVCDTIHSIYACARPRKFDPKILIFGEKSLKICMGVLEFANKIKSQKSVEKNLHTQVFSQVFFRKIDSKFFD